MSEILKTPIAGPTAWKREDLTKDDSWIYSLTQEESEEVRLAFKGAKAKGFNFQTVNKESFKLPLLGKKILRIQGDSENNRGFVLLRGVPIEGYDIDDIELIYTGIAAHMGRLINQDTKGTLIDHVADRGLSYDDIAVRGYTTNAQLTPHCDSGDLVVLLCVRPAKSGGVNSLSSSMTIYNEILKKHPEYLEALYKGFHYNIRGNGPTGKWADVTKHRVPLYSNFQGRLSCRYNQKAILTAEQLPNVPPLTDLEKEAVNFVAEAANREDLRFDFSLKAGDIVWLNNHVVLHTRTAFTDFEDPKLKRLLLRLWVNISNPRPLEESFADHYNTGPRKGPHLHSFPIGERIR